MEKTFSKIEINTIKSIAKNVAPYVNKKEKIETQIKEVEEKVAEMIRKRVEDKIAKLNAEKQAYQGIIDSMNATVKRMTGGYTTEDLVLCTKEGTGKVDDKGKEIMKTHYTLKYPETVIPVIVPPTTEGLAGSDFDADVENAQEEENNSEMPEELAESDAQVAEEAAEADPFADVDPFNQQ